MCSNCCQLCGATMLRVRRDVRRPGDTQVTSVTSASSPHIEVCAATTSTSTTTTAATRSSTAAPTSATTATTAHTTSTSLCGTVTCATDAECVSTGTATYCTCLGGYYGDYSAGGNCTADTGTNQIVVPGSLTLQVTFDSDLSKGTTEKYRKTRAAFISAINYGLGKMLVSTQQPRGIDIDYFEECVRLLCCFAPSCHHRLLMLSTSASCALQWRKRRHCDWLLRAHILHYDLRDSLCG